MNSPEIDPRDMNAIVKKIEELAPYYTPEWKFSAGDQEPGTALALSFAQMLAGIVNRFNKVPYKNFIAFLNMLGVEQFPAQPARAPVTFMLADGASNPVLVRAQTQVSADGEDGEGPVVFETESNMAVTPAALLCAFNVSVSEDKIIAFPDTFFLSPKEREKHDIRLFDASYGENLQEHAVYFSHDDFLIIGSPALITMEFQNTDHKFKEAGLAAAFINPRFTRWEYWGDKEGVLAWHEFDKCTGVSNNVVLVKKMESRLIDTEVNGKSAKWIRCVGAPEGMEILSQIEFNKAKISTDFYDETGKSKGITPDLLFYNDKTLETEEFYPFSEYFVLGDALYIASREVLSKKGTTVSLDIDLEIHELQMVTVEHEIKWKLIMKRSDVEQKEPIRTSVAKTVWEYWNGTGWARLQTDRASGSVFVLGDSLKTVKFVCPDDLEETVVNNYSNLWLRVRISKIDNMFAPSPKFLSPFIKSIFIKYYSTTAGKPVKHCTTYNNLDYRDRINDGSEAVSAFSPFYLPDQKAPAFYMGFDSPPVSGPISMFFSLIERKRVDEGNVFEWEYLRSKRDEAVWTKLKVSDRTDFLAQSETVVFSGPDDFAEKALFGRKLYWIRVVDTECRLDGKVKEHLMPRVNGIFMNTIWAVQLETVEKGILETVKGKGNREFKIYRTPVFSEEVWVDELDSLTPEERQRCAAEEGLETHADFDGRGEITAFWVKWQRVDDFYGSNEEDRHYILDPATGHILFGDDKNGKTPVTYEGNKIRIGYKTGGGTRGNVKAFGIGNLLNSLSYVDEIFNPEPALGGSNMESVESAVNRGPEILKHRNRAVTAEDVENLARQVSQSIKRVKCLPNRNSAGESETGWFTVVVAPLVEDIHQRPSTELKQQVLKYLKERAPGAVAFSRRIHVIEPVYVEISLYISLIAGNIDSIPYIEMEALDKINSFLSPSAGGYGGRGWEIGQAPHISMFYSLLKSVRGVNYVEKVSMTANILSDGKLVEIDPGKLGDMPHMLVVNGIHRVTAGVQQDEH